MEYQDYAERKAKRYIVSFAEDKDFTNVRESDLYIVDCAFNDISQTDDCMFSITERDDRKGYGIQMRGVMVVPATYLVIEDAPRWLRWIASKIFRVVSHPSNPI